MAPERVIPTADTFGNDHEKDEYVDNYLRIFQLTTFVRLAFSCKTIIFVLNYYPCLLKLQKKYLFSNKFNAVITNSKFNARFKTYITVSGHNFKTCSGEQYMR